MMALTGRSWLLLAVLCATCFASLKGESANRLSKLQHMKEEFEEFKKELDSLLEDSSQSEPEAVEQSEQYDEQPEANADQEPEEIYEDPEENLEESEQAESYAERPKPYLQRPAANEQPVEQDDENTEIEEAEKRCGPSGCVKKPPSVRVTCVKKCPTCTECVDNKSPAAVASAPQSDIMRRFLKVLKPEDQRLVQHARAKKEFIERLVRYSHYGPNKNDVEAEKQRIAAQEAAVLDIGVRALPQEDNSAMKAFKRSLTPEEQQLLSKHLSKTRFIQGLLEEKNTAHDNKDEAVNTGKRQSTDQTVQNYVAHLDESEKQLIQRHPSFEAKLKNAILAGTRGESASQQAKRGLSSEQIQNVINKLPTQADKDLAQNHLSKISNLAEAETRPVGNADEGAGVVVSRLVNDIKMAKRGGIDIEELIEALKKRANSSKKSSFAY